MSLKIDGHLAKIGENERIDVWARRNAIQDFDLQGSPFPDAVIMADYIEVNLYPCEWDVYYSMNRISLKKSTPYRVDRTEECRLYSCSGKVDQKINAHFTHLVKSGDSICGYNWRESFVSNIRYPGVRYNDCGSVYEYAKDLYLYSDSTLYKLSRNGYWDNGREINCSFEHFEEFGVINDKDAQICQTLGGYKFGKLVSISRFHTPRLQTGEYYVFSRAKSLKGKDIKIPQFLSPNLKYGVSLDAGKVYLCQLDDNKYLQSLILENLFDSSKYRDVLLSEDGKNILYRDEKKAIVIDVNGSVIQEYDNLSYVQQINGLRPLFDMPASLQPKLINPVTGQSLDCEEMSSYQYVSPNGELYADTRLDEYIEYYYRETNQLLSSEAYTRLLKKFRYPWDQKKGSLDWERVKENRKEFVLEHFEYLNNNYPGFINNDRTGKKWDTSVLDEDNRYGYFKALEFVIGKRGIAYIRKVANDSVVAKINLGEPLTFINFVSFSYDSRYVALAGYRGDRQSSWGGLFLVYDLEQNRICGSENTTRAIWMAVFSKSNALASYSSNPFTFFANNETEYELKDFESKLIERRSFLTFSPDGKLFALSSQGYVSKYDRDGNINAGWGHQPSSLVEIRLESSPDSSIAEYHDLSEYGIAGVASKAGSVASVSFSNDNKKLMMVGNDGVVIIRNLRFEA